MHWELSLVPSLSASNNSLITWYWYDFISVSSSSVLLDGKLMNLSCTQKGKELLLIAAPAEL